MMHHIPLLAALWLFSASAFAAPPAEEQAPALVVPNFLRDLAIEAGGRLAPPETPHLDLPSIGVPLVDNGRLAGYAFLNIRLHLGSEDDIRVIREHLHFVMHDLAALAHAHPFALVSSDDFTTGQTYQYWEEALDSRLGAGLVTEMEPLAAAVQLQRRRR